MNRALKFTIWHGLAASLALHSALALPFVVNALAPPPNDLPTLVIELQGVVSDAQAEERVAQQTPDQPPPPQQQQPTPPPKQAPPPEPDEDAAARSPEPQPQIVPLQQQVPPQARQVRDPDEQQKAQVIKTERDPDADYLREYVKRLTKKVQANLVYPDEGRKAGLQGNATVSFRLAADGQIRPGTLAVTTSSGQPKLDASALATVRACAPFEPPPREITVAFVVGYGQKR
jgi:protein TonB